MKKLLLTCLLSIATLQSYAQLDKRYFVETGFAMLGEERYGDAVKTLNLLLSIDDELHEAYFIRGLAKSRLGDMPGARNDLSRAIELNPVYTLAYYHRAILRANARDFDGALNDFSEVLELRPDITVAYFNRAIALMNKGDFERAVSDMGRYIRLEGGDAETHVLRGDAYLKMQDTLRARADFDTAIALDHNYANAYYRRGILEASQERWDEALADLTQAVESDPGHLPALFDRAAVYHQTGRQNEALQDLNRVIEQDGGYTAAYYNRAVILSQAGLLGEALEDYNTVAESNPNNVLVFFNRAGVYATQGNYRAAVADYSRAIELYPDFATAYMQRSEVKALMGNTRGAADDLNTARRKIGEYRLAAADSTYSIYADPERNFSRLVAFDTPFARGLHERSVNVSAAMRPMFRYLHARGTMALSTAENPLTPEELMNIQGGDFERGVANMLSKQYTNAVNLFSSAIERDPTDGKLYLARAVARAEMIDFISSIDTYRNPSGILKPPSARTYNYDEAFADINKALRLMPGEARVVYNRGNLNVAADRMADALEDYTAAIALETSLAEAWFNRGLVHIHLKDVRQGLLDLGKAGELGITEAYEILKTYEKYD